MDSAFNWLDHSLPMTTQNSASSQPTDAPKRHSACDECRQRKLKCSGEPAGCQRCDGHGLACHYSFRKQMGRPPKRKQSTGALKPSIDPPLLDRLDAADPFYSVPDPLGTLEATRLCTPIYKMFIERSHDLRPGPFLSEGPLFELGGSQSPLQTSSTAWVPPPYIDYSQLAPVLSDPFSGAGLTNNSSNLVYPQGLTACSCLSSLYLSLSSISTLPSFPVSPFTLATLYNAAQTARSVLHCEICPKTYSSSLQNLMFLGTLLSVAADSWFWLSTADGEALGKETVSEAYISLIPSDPELSRRHWKNWLWHVVQHAVIGGVEPPVVDALQNRFDQVPSLLALIEQAEERQQRWHSSRDLRAGAGYAPESSQQHRQQDEGEPLCFRIVGSARKVIDRFRFEDTKI
ncbi:hypothetical protein FQN57_000892 [Myotisia sp. PD_48]|nr:hypothetical protein FQN57_000892 [Myotisia sp. PD_48]